MTENEQKLHEECERLKIELAKTEHIQDEGRRAVARFNKLERRFGQFSISMELIGDPNAEKTLSLLFSKFIVLRADECIFWGSIKYIVWSRDLKVMEDNVAEIPMYYIEVTQHEDGTITMKLDEMIVPDDPRANSRLVKAWRRFV